MSTGSEVFGFGKEDARRIAKSIRQTEGQPILPPRSPPPTPGMVQLKWGYAYGAIKKVTNGYGSGTVNIWSYNNSGTSGATNGYAITGEQLTNVNVLCIPDGYQVPDGAECLCALINGPNYGGWYVISFWPCFEPIPSGS